MFQSFQSSTYPTAAHQGQHIPSNQFEAAGEEKVIIRILVAIVIVYYSDEAYASADKLVGSGAGLAPRRTGSS